MKHGKEQWRLDERILIQSIKSVTVYFLKEQYMWFSGGNGLKKEVKQMERLTQRENNKLIMVKQDNGEYIPVYWDEDNFKAIKKLADYENLEEQGLLVRLPVNKNKEIYIISSRWTVCSECGSRFDEYSCSGCEYECDSKKEYYVCPTYLSSINVNTYINRFGKTVFLTREEAEKKLDEMKK